MNVEQFAALHVSGNPLILYNAWDAGSARAIAEAGAKAIATGSASLAASQGYPDGEELPLEGLLTTVRQIAGAIELPLSVDFESGFAEDLETLAANAANLAAAGAVGCNLEDRLIGAGGLRDTAEQAERIGAFAKAGIFVNARTDVFLSLMMAGEDPNRADLVPEAIARAAAYAEGGAGSFFIPGLSNPDLIAEIVDAVSIPVNAMRLPGMIANAELAKLGVARISYAAAPWRAAMASVTEAAKEAFAG